MEMKLRTRLGIELPIIKAPMAGVQGRQLAVAVSNAGELTRSLAEKLD
jgi:nitronate monooxygenase